MRDGTFFQPLAAGTRHAGGDRREGEWGGTHTWATWDVVVVVHTFSRGLLLLAAGPSCCRMLRLPLLVPLLALALVPVVILAEVLVALAVVIDDEVTCEIMQEA